MHYIIIQLFLFISSPGLGIPDIGFNGKDSDNEVKGNGNQQDYGFRVYDPRVGRFLSVDPLAPKYPELTPYQFASGRPIDGIDVDGLEWGSATTNSSQTQIKLNIKFDNSDGVIPKIKLESTSLC